MDTFNLVELARRVENIIRLGTIAEADYSAARVRVQYDEDEKGNPVISQWMPWLTRRAGNDTDWWAPEVGEQVMILSPSGNLALGVALPAIYQSAHPAPESNVDKHRTSFSDGSFVEYDRSAHKLNINVNGGDVVLSTTGNVDATVGGDTNVTSTGNVNIDGAEVILNQGGNEGVVCQKHVCAFTGSPHPQGSTTVKAGG